MTFKKALFPGIWEWRLYCCSRGWDLMAQELVAGGICLLYLQCGVKAGLEQLIDVIDLEIDIVD